MQMLAGRPLNSVYSALLAMVIWMYRIWSSSNLLPVVSYSLPCSDLVIIILDLGYIMIRQRMCIWDKGANIPLIARTILWQVRVRRRSKAKTWLTDLFCSHWGTKTASQRALVRVGLVRNRKCSSVPFIVGHILRLATIVSRIGRNPGFLTSLAGGPTGDVFRGWTCASPNHWRNVRD